MWQVVLYINPATVALFVAAVVALSATAAWWHHRSDGCAANRRVDRGVQAMLAAWTVLVLAATIMPTQPLGTGGHDIFWTPGEGLWTPTGEGGAALFAEERDMIVRLQIANAAMFVPLASLLTFSAPGRPAGRVVALCLLLSTAIETIQFVMAAGRTVDVDDLLFNTVGAVLGVAAARGSLYAVGRLSPSGVRRA
ncbi:VanZ family protein [Streptomyces sp. bgisy100]|uniref:VanZ family protein n=1 Tax=Streptomyces sp. bgisy100 TaxID=3413783 RepID=UPI003D70656A